VRVLIAAIESEFGRYKALAEGAMRQVGDEELHRAGGDAANSIAVIVQHIAGNLTSRFTDFLTADGEKPWRDRDAEFVDRQATRGELMAAWEEGWRVLFAALADLADNNASRQIIVRGQPWRVDEALLRALAHASYHVGQIVHIAKTFRGDGWQTLSIPKGGSAAYNAGPIHDRPAAHATKLRPPADRP
jgi:hypothetical protein